MLGHVCVRTKYVDQGYGRGRYEVDKIWLEGGPEFVISDERFGGPSLAGKKVGDVVTYGPFRFRLLARRYEWDGFLARQETRVGWLYLWRYAVSQRLVWVYYRLVLTAAVWGLARWPQGGLPSWRDVYALARIGGGLRKVRAWRAR